MNTPATSRYAATSPDMLRWFKAYNAGRPYRDQVKPFGFLLSLGVALDFGGETMALPKGRGRPRKEHALKPVAPFDSDLRAASEQAFCRVTGVPVPVSSLRTFAGALAQYHISPEAKFLNGDYWDRGTTHRRHVRMVAVRSIGKEAHDWERQAVLGLNAQSEIAYGLSAISLADQLLDFVSRYGDSQGAKKLGITRRQLIMLLSTPEICNAEWAGKAITRLSEVLKQNVQMEAEKIRQRYELRKAVEQDGLRATARALGIDPEPPRDCRRPLGLNYAAMGVPSSMA